MEQLKTIHIFDKPLITFIIQRHWKSILFFICAALTNFYPPLCKALWYLFSKKIIMITVKPLIVDPPRKGHNIKDLSTRDTIKKTLFYKGHCTTQAPKNYPPYSFNILTTSEKRMTDLSTKDKTIEFILSPTCPLFGGSTVYISLPHHHPTPSPGQYL